MNRKTRNYFILAAIVILAAALIFLGLRFVIVRAVLMIPFVLILPGYVLTTALLPQNTLGGFEKLLYSLGLSLAITALTGLILNLTPWGLNSISWAVSLGGITILAWLSTRLRGREFFVGDLRIDADKFRQWRTWLMLFVILAMIGVVAFAQNGVYNQDTPAYTQFWALPIDKTTSAIRLGVHNMEVSPMQYKLEVKVAGNTIYTMPTIELTSDKTWETTLQLPVKQNMDEMVEADLFRLDLPEKVYRHVILWRTSTGE